MKQIMQTLLGDFSLLYKNFIHWNISKILIVIFSFLLGILFALPFFIILIVLMNLDPIEWKDIISTFYTTQTVGLSFLTAISTHLFYVIIEITLVILGFLSFGFGSSYQLVLKAKLNLDYKKGILTGFLKNYYFSISKIWKTIGIFSWIGLVFLGLFFLVALIIIASIFLYGGIDNAYMLAVQSETISSFSLLVLFITILGILIFLYLAYRMNYAYIIMLDEENYPNEKSALSYVKESFTLTAGVKFFKFLLVAVLFSVCILFPIDYLGQYLEGIDSKIGVFFYTIVVFLTINGLFEMLLVSTYYSIMLDDAQKIHASSQQEVI